MDLLLLITSLLATLWLVPALEAESPSKVAHVPPPPPPSLRSSPGTHAPILCVCMHAGL